MKRALAALLFWPSIALADVPYACPTGPAPPTDSGPVDVLVDAWRPYELRDVAADIRLETALGILAEIDPATLTTAERIWGQNVAFEIELHAYDSRALRRQAWRVVNRLAFEPKELAALGSEPDSSLEAWIGARESWIERAGPSCGDGPLVHERAYQGTRAFRPVSTAAQRALVHQLIAIDTEGNAHVTPVIAEVELRLGHGKDAPACILEGAPDALYAAKIEEITPTTFVRPNGAKLGCDGCHYQDAGFFGFQNIPPTDSVLSARRIAVEALATKSAR